MDRTGYGFPSRPWTHSAATTQVLLTGQETPDSRVLTLALFELVVRRSLRLVTARDRILFFPKQRNVLVREAVSSQSTDPVMHRLSQPYGNPRRFADGTSGLTIRAQTKHIRDAHRREGGIVHGVVMPELHRKGWVQKETYRRIGLFERTRWVITERGREALTEISLLMDAGRGGLSQWILHDPAQAVAYVKTAGPALLLLDSIGWSMQTLHHAMERAGGSYTELDSTARDRSLQSPDSGPWDRDRWRGANSTDAFSVAALAGIFGPGPLDGLDTAYRTIEAAVDVVFSSGSGGGE